MTARQALQHSHPSSPLQGTTTPDISGTIFRTVAAIYPCRANPISTQRTGQNIERRGLDASVTVRHFHRRNDVTNIAGRISVVTTVRPGNLVTDLLAVL